jgi:methyl-accepting chemotaxis protein
MFKSVQIKIVFLLVIFFVLQAIVLFFIATKLHGVSTEYRSVFEREAEQRAQVDLINLSFKIEVQEWKNVLLRATDAGSLEQYWSKFETAHKNVQAQVDGLIAMGVEADLARQASAFKSTHETLLAKYRQGVQLFQQSFDAHMGDAAVKGVDRAPTEALSALSLDMAARMKTRLDGLHQSSQTLALGIDAVVVVMSIIACVGLFWFMRILLVRPIRQLQEHIGGMAACDFSEVLVLDRQDEFGQLSQSLGIMRKELSHVLGSVISVSAKLSQSSGSLSVAAKGIDDDTHHAQDHAGQIAAAMTQMGASITDVANNANVAADATNVANQGAEEGLRIMDDAIVAISAVREEVTKISADMSSLEQNTVSVGAVLDVIKGIAEQTNLLALNAAIEAARAGEQGRGFAVVADEVRALAKRTQESTEEIQHIIEAVQSGAKTASKGMEAGNQKTEYAVGLARDAGTAIRKIADEIGRVQAMNAQIATAAEEQSAATDEINRNVVNMTSLSERAHESAAKTHTIATDLYGMVDNLSVITSKFKLP